MDRKREKDEIRATSFGRPKNLLKKSEEIKQNNSMNLDAVKSEIKDLFNMNGPKSAKDDQISLTSDLAITQRKESDGHSKKCCKGNFLKF